MPLLQVGQWSGGCGKDFSLSEVHIKTFDTLLFWELKLFEDIDLKEILISERLV